MSQSSELAGGDGFTFEGHVAAYYLAALLAKRKTGGCDGDVVEVATQQRNFDKPLDDIIITWKDSSDRSGTTSLQVKREVIISSAKNNKDFREVIRDSWYTFQKKEFKKGVDKYGMAIGYIAPKNLRALRNLCEVARESNDAKHFEKRLSVGSINKTQLTIKNDIEKILKEECGVSLTIENLRLFLSHFIITQFDFLHEGALSPAEAETYLREFLAPNQTHLASLVWSHFHTIIRISGAKSGKYDYDRLVNDLAKVIPVGAKKLLGTKTKFLEDSSNYIQNKFSKIPVLGVQTPISLQSCWIPLKATIVESSAYNSNNLELALKDYHDFHELKIRDQMKIDASSFGRFVRQAVIIGGPGIGKSTLLKKLALDYSSERKLVIFVKLPTLLTYLEDKTLTFEECLLYCGFENSLDPSIDYSIFKDSIILGDGLDECGNRQSIITNAFHLFSQKYKTSRVLLSSRPIGYVSGLLGDWRHYQLQPIEENNISDAVTKIIKALEAKDTRSIDKKVDLIQHQIKSKFVKGLASRSPLILSLMSVLALKSDEIATNRASLYRQFFSLIQKNATERQIDITPNSSIRLEFLYALGYVLYSKDLPLLDEIYDELTKILIKQLGGNIFEIKRFIGECISYWEEMGVIEQVQTLTESTITFIHKTFCEFTFAKYIENCNYEMQKEVFNHFYNDSNFIEVISFLSHLGLSNTILEFLRDLSIEDKKLNLSKYLEVIIESSVDWNSKNVEEFLELCWRETNNIFSTHRYHAGEALYIASSHCWQMMIGKIEAYKNSDDEWVKAIVNACLLSNEEYPISNEYLLECLEFFKSGFPTRSELSSSVVIRFNDPLNKMRDAYILHLTKRIVSQHLLHPESKDILESYLLSILGKLSFKLGHELREIFKKFNLDLKVQRESLLANNHEIFNSLQAYKDCDRNFFSIFIYNYDDKDIVLNSNEEKYFEMGAFYHLLNLHQTTLDCFSIFFQPVISVDDIRIIIFENLAKLAGLNYSVLQRQAKIRLQMLDNEEMLYSIFGDLPEVDIAIDYKNTNLSIEILPYIKHAILLDNGILSYAATQIALAFVNSLEFENMVCDLIFEGEGDDLHYSAYLGTHIPNERFQQVLFEKLTTKNLTQGCRNLFKFLDPNFNQNLFWDAIYKALSSSNPYIALSAVKSTPNDLLEPKIIEKLAQYYEDWKLKEKPYPENGGAVPTTPREELVKILLPFYVKDVSFLQKMTSDCRPEIKKLSIKPLVDLAKKNLTVKQWIVSKVSNENLLIDCFKLAIQNKVYLDDYEMIIPFLSHIEPRVRYIATTVLYYETIPPEIVNKHAKLLLKDPVIEIREIAHNILKS